MIKILFSLALITFSFSSFAFESGLYTGETESEICELKINQHESSLMINAFKCELKDDSFGISFGKDRSFKFGTYEFTEQASDGSILKIQIVVSEKLFSYKIYDEDGLQLLTLVFESNDSNKVHLILTDPFTVNEDWIDMDISKKD